MVYGNMYDKSQKKYEDIHEQAHEHEHDTDNIIMYGIMDTWTYTQYEHEDMNMNMIQTMLP